MQEIIIENIAIYWNLLKVEKIVNLIVKSKALKTKHKESYLVLRPVSAYYYQSVLAHKKDYKGTWLLDLRREKNVVIRDVDWKLAAGMLRKQRQQDLLL